MLDLKSLRNLLKRVESVNVRSKKFNLKWVKNVLEIRKFVSDFEQAIKPDREFELYLEQYQKAKGNEKINVKKAFKSAINRHKEKLKKVSEIFSNRPLNLEEFTIDELPSSIDTKTLKLLYELGLIKEEEKK